MDKKKKNILIYLVGVIIAIIFLTVFFLTAFRDKEAEENENVKQEWDASDEFGDLDNVPEFSRTEEEEEEIAVTTAPDNIYDRYQQSILSEAKALEEGLNDLPPNDEMADKDPMVIDDLLHTMNPLTVSYGDYTVAVPTYTPISSSTENNVLKFNTLYTNFTVTVNEDNIVDLNNAIEAKCMELDENYTKEIISSVSALYNKEPNVFTSYTCNYIDIDGKTQQVKYLSSQTPYGLTYFVIAQSTTGEIVADEIFPVLEYYFS